jgi:hypothetical protein
MRDITVTRQVYLLAELDDTARTAAIELLRNENYENIPSDMISESLNGQLVYLLTGEWVGDITDKELKKLTGSNFRVAFRLLSGRRRSDLRRDIQRLRNPINVGRRGIYETYPQQSRPPLRAP